jgi:pimeloyl-ACP methyl ester carboxylesterase
MKARSSDGAEIFYEVYDFTDPWKTPEAVLLHHGGRGNHQQWYKWIPLLSGHYRTIAVDARGRGGSTVPPADYIWSMEQLSADMVAVLDDAKVEKVHYMGMSFGSLLGEFLAVAYPERIRTLTFIAPAYQMAEMKATTDGWVRDIERLGSLEFHRREVRKMFPPTTDPALLEWQAHQMAAVSADVVRSFMAFTQTINNAGLLSKIQAPTLLIVPNKSDRFPTTEAEFMQQRIPHARILSFDAPHNLMLSIPVGLPEAILDFLHKHRGNS